MIDEGCQKSILTCIIHLPIVVFNFRPQTVINLIKVKPWLVQWHQPLPCRSLDFLPVALQGSPCTIYWSVVILVRLEVYPCPFSCSYRPTITLRWQLPWREFSAEKVSLWIFQTDMKSVFPIAMRLTTSNNNHLISILGNAVLLEILAIFWYIF